MPREAGIELEFVPEAEQAIFIRRARENAFELQISCFDFLEELEAIDVVIKTVVGFNRERFVLDIDMMSVDPGRDTFDLAQINDNGRHDANRTVETKHDHPYT